MYVLLLVCIAAILCQSKLVAANNNVSNKETLYVLSQLPYPVPNSAGQLPTWIDGIKFIPALDLAERQINNKPDLLPNYNLKLVHINGGCDFTDIAVANFTEAVTSLARTESKRFVGVIGPGCSRSTYGLGSIVSRPDFNLVTIHGAGASIFANRKIYPYYFGSLGSVEVFGELAVDLIEEANWHKIAFLFHNSRLYYSSMKNEIVSAINNESDVKIVYSSMVRLNNFIPLEDLAHSRARIIFVVTPLEHLLQIMCRAYHLKMFYPNYQWVIFGRMLSDFSDGVSFVHNNDKNLTQCSGDELKKALNNSFLTNFQLSSSDNVTKTVANITRDEYLNLYQQEIDLYNSIEANPFRNVSTSVWASYFYDSLWALAITLDSVTKKSNVNLSDYQYNDKNTTRQIVEELYNVNIQGVSGPVQYSRNSGFLMREINLIQVVHFTENFIPYSINAGLSADIYLIPDEFKVEDNLYPVLSVLFGIIASIQLLVIVTLHILTLVYRNHKFIKASSPGINQIAFIGIYLLWFGLLLICIHGHPNANLSGQANAVFCQLQWAWFLPIGFILSLSPVIVRTWRLYRIFIHYLNPGPFISNPILITIICIMVTIDLVVAIVWTTIDQYEILLVNTVVQQDGANMIVLRLRCSCNYNIIWIAIIMFYRVATLVVLCVLAVLTRRIKNQTFTTASLRVFGYIMTIIFGLGFSIYYLLISQHYYLREDFAVLCLTINLTLLAFTTCVFMPPLLQLLKEKKLSVYKNRNTRSGQTQLNFVGVTNLTYFLSGTRSRL